MVVNGDGDLELSSVYDTPKQTTWSSRGDLAMGAGYSFRVISAIVDDQVSPEPWDLPEPSHPTRSGATSHSHSRGREHRRPTDPDTMFTPPRYNHRDAESPLGTRSVSQAKAANLAATRPDKRSFSPASLRVHEAPLHSTRGGDLLKRSTSRPRRDKVSLSPAPRQRSSSKPKKNSSKGAAATVEDDISMVMRKRVISGYGIKNVGCSSFKLSFATHTFLARL